MTAVHFEPMTNKRALVVVHDPGATAAVVGERFEHHGYSLHQLRLTEDIERPASDVPFPDPADYDVILPMGAVYSVYDTDRIGSWIGRELEFLRRADRAGVPVFGVCFGGQALAAAHGGEVVKSDQNQVGWHPIPSETPALATGPWMQWHYDRFEAPSDAELLSKDHWGTQAFRLRRNLGVQFHPEVDGTHLQVWFDYGGISELERFGMKADDLMAETVRNAELARPHTNALIDWFLSDIATSETTTPMAS